jgi:sialate O-acetylesterase
MQFAMPAIENATAEAALADKYPTIRLFTVGQKTSSKIPLHDLQTIEQNWTVASHTTIAGGGRFGYFSAVCWIFGRTIHDKLGGKVPLGYVIDLLLYARVLTKNVSRCPCCVLSMCF